uniref:Uncharacterized protein n=1 Tax=Anguilla anguilla TaxID=7936 RepID=A0A0E9PM22_ANGAN
MLWTHKIMDRHWLCEQENPLAMSEMLRWECCVFRVGKQLIRICDDVSDGLTQQRGIWAIKPASCYCAECLSLDNVHIVKTDLSVGQAVVAQVIGNLLQACSFTL